jgi:flagellin
MALVVNTNTASINAQRQLGVNTNALQKNLERLASGLKINSASDNAAGLQISETLGSQIRGINQAVSNAQDGVNLLSVAEGSLSVINDNLQRIRELTVQAASDTNGSSQRTAIKQEIDARLSDINRIASSAEFNGIKLLSTATPSSLRIQVGANAVQSLDTLNIAGALGDSSATTLGVVVSAGAVISNASALAFLSTVDTAINAVSTKRASIGSFQNRFASAISNLQITSQNFEASRSQIRDADIAQESAGLARNQILQSAATSILAQANQSSALALRLIG